MTFLFCILMSVSDSNGWRDCLSFLEGIQRTFGGFLDFLTDRDGEIPPLNRNKGKLVHTCFFSMFKKQHQASLAMMVLGNVEKVDEGILLFPCLILESYLVVYLQFFLTFFYMECFFSFTNATLFSVFSILQIFQIIYWLSRLTD